MPRTAFILCQLLVLNVKIMPNGPETSFYSKQQCIYDTYNPLSVIRSDFNNGDDELLLEPVRKRST